MSFKFCKRCGEKALEQLRTHSSCYNCNYSPDIDDIEDIKKFKTFENKEQIPISEVAFFIERIIWQSVSKGSVPEVKAKVTTTKGRVHITIKPLKKTFNEETRRMIQKILYSKIKREAYLCNFYFDFKFLN